MSADMDWVFMVWWGMKSVKEYNVKCYSVFTRLHCRSCDDAAILSFLLFIFTHTHTVHFNRNTCNNVKPRSGLHSCQGRMLQCPVSGLFCLPRLYRAVIWVTVASNQSDRSPLTSFINKEFPPAEPLDIFLFFALLCCVNSRDCCEGESQASGSFRLTTPLSKPLRFFPWFWRSTWTLTDAPCMISCTAPLPHDRLVGYPHRVNERVYGCSQ